MKKCPSCGRLYPDEAVACQIDATLLVADVQPEPASPPKPARPTYGRYASFWPRFCAGFIDGAVLTPLSFLNYFISDPDNGPVVRIICVAISYLGYCLYSVILHARFGQTVGKMAMKIQVQDVSETRIPTFRQAVLRDIGEIVTYIIGLFLFMYIVLTGTHLKSHPVLSALNTIVGFAALTWFLLEVITMLMNKKRRALHDFIAGTVVVRK